MRILHIASHDAFLRGGAVQILRMVKGQSRLGCSGTVVLNRDSCDGLLQCIEGFRLICRRLNAKNLVFLLELSKGHEVVHTHKPQALRVGFFAKLILRKPVFFQRGTTYRLKGLSFTGVRALSIPVIAVSHAVKRVLLKSGLREDKVHVVYGSAEYSDVKRERRKLPALGIVAAFTGKKGYPLFFTLAGRLLSFASFKFYVFGSGKKSKFEEYYRDIRESVSFMGYVSDSSKIYGTIDLLLCTSLKGEGFTGSVREAMLYGVPVATTPVSGNPEFVDAFKTGLILDFEAEGSAAVLLKAVFNPALLTRLSRNAKRKALRFFTVERQAERMIEIYRGAER
ncbi:MAG: glycosyltransferase family 4 protein [Deferribacteres bacterium]|nr:glycosyltransferase family 4 protein [Deferribacteres bacterium]